MIAFPRTCPSVQCVDCLYVPHTPLQVASLYRSALQVPVTATRPDLSPAGPDEDQLGHVRKRHRAAAQPKQAKRSVVLNSFTPAGTATRLGAARFFTDSLVLMVSCELIGVSARS